MKRAVGHEVLAVFMPCFASACSLDVYYSLLTVVCSNITAARHVHHACASCASVHPPLLALVPCIVNRAASVTKHLCLCVCAGALCNVLWAHGVLQTLTPELFDKVCEMLEAKPLAEFKPHVSLHAHSVIKLRWIGCPAMHLQLSVAAQVLLCAVSGLPQHAHACEQAHHCEYVQCWWVEIICITLHSCPYALNITQLDILLVDRLPESCRHLR